MNNEIKEILDNLKDEVWSKTGADSYDKLLDYITNLQQENERLKTKTKEQSLLLIDYQDMEQKLEDYKSRIEKAVGDDLSEIERLNNIINELGKWLNDICVDPQSNFAYRNCLNKLQELRKL